MTALPIISSDPVIPAPGPVADKPWATQSNRQSQRAGSDAPPDAPGGPDQKNELPSAGDQADQSPARQKPGGPTTRSTARSNGKPKSHAGAGRAGKKKARRKSAQPHVADEIPVQADGQASLTPFSEVISTFSSARSVADDSKGETIGKAHVGRVPGDQIKGLDAGIPVAHPLQGILQPGPNGPAPAGQPASRVASQAMTAAHLASPGREASAEPTPGHEAQPVVQATVPLAVALPGAPAATGADKGQTSRADPTGATPQVIEGGQTAFKSVQPQSVVGAEIGKRADASAAEAGPAVVQPAQPRLSSQHAADATVDVESAGGQSAGGQPARPQTMGNPAESVESPPPAAGNVDSVSPGESLPQVASPPRPAWHVAAHQVTEQVRLAGPQVGQRVVVRLNPPELGRVRLTLRGGRGGIRGTLEVDNVRTLAELRNATPPMIERLAESGIQLRHLDLILSGQNQGNSPNTSGSSLRDGALAQQQNQNGQAHGGRARQDDSADGSAEGGAGRTAPGYVSDDSINVWI